MSIQIKNFDYYIDQHKKIFIYQLNFNPYAKQETINKNIDYNNKDDENNENDLLEINKIKISNNDVIVEDINLEEDSYDEDKNVADTKNNKNELYHLNICHLNSNNNYNWFNDYMDSEQEQNDFISHVKKYLDQSNGLKKNKDKDKYKIISETCKIKLDEGTINDKSLGYISTTLLNQSKLYDGLTNITILTNPRTHIISSVNIRTRTCDNELINPIYRNILWELEFEECDEGYRILGLDNFIHISLVGLEEIFLDIKYDIEGTTNLRLGYLKFDRCYYNSIIKKNLAKHLYENEETYFVDIIDWIVQEFIDIDQQEQMYGDIYGTNYNILRIMAGMGGIAYSN